MRLGHIEVTSLLALGLTWQLSPVHCANEPCLDLYKDAHRPKVYNTADLQDTSSFEGVAHKTITGMHHHGTRQLEMWMQTLVPGVVIPPHTHGGEEWVMVLKGTATFKSRDLDMIVSTQTLRSNDSITVLPEVVHNFSNLGEEDIQLIVALVGDLHSVLYPSWEAHASEAQRLDPQPWDVKCPSQVPQSLQPLQREAQGRDEL
ncbi:hypothetical protein CVIRNUC_007819 [Coccomyxa viridis]|uniref:Cupin 2 conserved barrel domain-containing protein n=1 Tax=Coccomyxa viridis TaxID=1274662 RepID=A0AAV1IDT6_9CHLO|nr:hypothetical protein CVIRNUC_007819 [Coccomyxa viridis]